MPATVQRSPAFNGRTGQRAASLVAADGRAACCTTRHPQVLWFVAQFSDDGWPMQASISR